MSKWIPLNLPSVSYKNKNTWKWMEFPQTINLLCVYMKMYFQSNYKIKIISKGPKFKDLERPFFLLIKLFLPIFFHFYFSFFFSSTNTRHILCASHCSQCFRPMNYLCNSWKFFQIKISLSWDDCSESAFFFIVNRNILIIQNTEFSGPFRKN